MNKTYHLCGQFLYVIHMYLLAQSFIQFYSDNIIYTSMMIEVSAIDYVLYICYKRKLKRAYWPIFIINSTALIWTWYLVHCIYFLTHSFFNIWRKLSMLWKVFDNSLKDIIIPISSAFNHNPISDVNMYITCPVYDTCTYNFHNLSCNEKCKLNT